jgi:hypothetical protein
VRVSLARTGRWLRDLGSVPDGFAVPADDGADLMESGDSGWGRLGSMRHAARFSPELTLHLRPSMPPASHSLAWAEQA